MNDDPTTEILDATYQALCKHGYAELTVQDIAAESAMSKASIHYHYDSKDDLFVACLESLYDRYTAHIEAAAGETPRKQLRSLLELLVTDTGEISGTEFRTAMLELKAQAPYNEEIQDRLVEFDAVLFERLEEIIEAGVSRGEFTDRIDPSVAAESLTTTIMGAHTRRVAVDHSTDRLYEMMTGYIETNLLTEMTVEGRQ
ncbi:TetR/AcrR family transcriptional regulator [Natrinema versiforme]|uniref:TetR/AcrR family transcriptional regulator n=1 Tax=Natrinema versiforme TaxID=88724 RepID=A0A4P8WQT0_9EURY|nr:TetR/AcrR family transcriptional regulator [Natrinema versiforme]QCS44873.1 TetR/AcrR family transcriptional regulator [Natrinema versiforme]